ncbi:cell wall synthase accessory phosphoprotein MacP [Streptococcus suis]|uniref:cell wall synthase accessory phosphoprotein MacP n=2 Tax=Streptococcus suis TaxID=1307 RepID=UPI0023D7F778|nr:cell wall synthase accessory phosphoprotein MacP [Streptococcus suis]
MGKPLLTDEILEKVKKKQYSDQSGQFGHYRPNQDISMDDVLFDPYLEEDYQGYEEGQTIRIPVKPTVVKSRRIETIKREAFRSKVNKILFWVIILLIMFIIAVLFI